MSGYLLEMKGIAKRFNGVPALDGIDLAIRPGECIGLCGENGAGKSTLMKVLSAVYPHGSWDGEIVFDGRLLRARSVRETEDAGIIIIHQELMLVPELTVAENIFLGNEITLPGGRLDYHAMNRRAEEILRELKLPDVNVVLPVKNYGGGHQQLIEIGKALNKNARLLILDEPSASLTASEIAVLLEIIRDLKARGVACVYISHKLEEVAAICDTIVVIRDGKHIATTPMPEMSVDRIIAQMCGRELNQLYPSLPHEVGEVVMEARHITCYDPDQPQRKKVDDVSFQLRRGEILGVAGIVGAGRTELVTAIFGSYPGRHTGEVWLDGRRVDNGEPLKAIRNGFALVPEDRKHHGIVRDLSVGENITLSVLGRYAHLTRIDDGEEGRDVQEQIRRLALKTATPALPITALSGGNQQKAVLAKMLLTQPKVLILDEPTRGVDVGAKFEIYKLMLELAAQGIAIIMVSSELSEVLGVSDRVLVMGEGRLRGEFQNQGLTQETVLAAALGQHRTNAG
ncbi:D-xylose ABC transporter ATP-binding protein [Massilia sp. YIM B02443]|uniref:D-xylose ABC transporter ATP-binding protein n=1 Tax=Massilia sp. YIM B02443 TaxID=3050127 RepID=UPI0025B679C1|nr:D-xylose ABC transporter ATP-binding protein [Massilia sp. YIM B02443]MDN4038538.1 D-xylose ABC transporter ATP-binding protein [Massilia sp. YIM B02443]